MGFFLTQLEVTSAGVVATVGAVGVALRSAGQAERRWQSDKDDRQLAHARLVTVETNVIYSHKIAQVFVHNNGPESILTVVIVDVTPRPDGVTISGYPSDHGRPEVGDVEIDHRFAEVVRPLERAEISVFCRDDQREHVPWSEDRLRVTFEFMDAQGKCWRRVGREEPQRIDRVTWELYLQDD